ncbi:uncharacterized protein LOC129585349 isoform X2 [Paramacrobiotus metropolitanus]|uniref:uncharacterized protein LOC129585349 isoform X2 n=1 Tax=Paramacrobiotus metropolitanus TaxID=2943436 RepID=UPI0024457214|nr:uncharacterized protein LOC129585349 isoform X2 [Paramacrobiotus metropolitanus]
MRCPTTWILVPVMCTLHAVTLCEAQGPQGNSSWSLDAFLGQYDFVLETRHLIEELIYGVLDVPKDVANGPTSIIFSKTRDGSRYQQQTVRIDPRYNVTIPFVLGVTSVQSRPGHWLTSTFTMVDQFTLRSRISYLEDNTTAEYSATFSFNTDASGISGRCAVSKAVSGIRISYAQPDWISLYIVNNFKNL